MKELMNTYNQIRVLSECFDISISEAGRRTTGCEQYVTELKVRSDGSYPRMKNAIAIARAFNVSLDDFAYTDYRDTPPTFIKRTPAPPRPYVEQIEELSRIKGVPPSKAVIEAGLSAGYLCRLKKTETQPTLYTAAMLCDYFGISLEDFAFKDFSKEGK